MKVVAMFKGKGGVGATTAVANLAAEFHQREHRVAALDVDPAGHLSAWARLGEGVLARIVETLDPDPAAIRSRLDALRRARTSVVLLDCPASYSDAGIAAVLLATLVVVPATPSALDVLALRQTVALVRSMRRGGRPAIALLPAKVTATGLGRDLAVALAGEGLPVLPGIPQRADIARATMRGLTVVEASRSSDSTKAFAALASAILEVS